MADLVQQCSQVLKQLQGIMVTYRCVFHTRVMPLGGTFHSHDWPISMPWQLILARACCTSSCDSTMLPSRNYDRLPLHRMTSKPKPTKSSHYVHGILKGLSALLATDAASKLAKDTSSSIAKVGAAHASFYLCWMQPAQLQICSHRRTPRPFSNSTIMGHLRLQCVY